MPGEVHHLGDAEHVAAAEQPLEVADRQRPPRRLVRRRGHARRRHEVDVERQARGRVEQPVDAVRAEHVRDLVRVGDDRGRAEREDQARELVDHQLRGLDVQVRVDEAGDDVAPGGVDDLGAVVVAQPGDDAVADRDVGVEPLAREHGEDAAAADDEVGRLVSARYRDTALQLRDIGHPAILRAWTRCCRAISLLVGPDEPAAADDVLAADDEAVDAVRPREHEPGDGIGRAAELQPVDPPDGEVGALAGLERADVLAAQHRRAAARAEPQRLAHGQRGRAAAAARDEQRLLDLEEEVAALVRGGAVDAEPDAHAGVEQVAHRRDARAEAQVRGRAVRDADAGLREQGDVGRRQVDAMRAPDVPGEPADALQVLDRAAAVGLAAELLLVERLGEVRVQAAVRACARAPPTPPSAGS